MTQAIIYKTQDGVAVIHPTAEALALYSIEAIAQKDVPAPKKIYDVPTGEFELDEGTGEQREVRGSRIQTYPFKIIDVSQIPTDRTFRAAWDADFTAPDGVGALSNEFPEVAA